MEWLGWLNRIVLVFDYFILFFYVVKELYILTIALISWRELRSDEYFQSHGRLHELASSDSTPPVSIIMPAYNEEAGIAEAVRSMAMTRYPRFEIVVVNDGSKDRTVEVLLERFDLIPVNEPYRQVLDTKAVRTIYRSRSPIPLVVVDKENGGKGDALNTGINVARYPYVLLTDGDTVVEEDALLRMARYIVADRSRTVAVGGNVRPINGSVLRAGKVTQIGLPRSLIERVQIVEYVRSFLGARPGWSRLNGLLIVSGAFGLFRRQALVEVGGMRHGHLGEDMEMTLRLHRHFRRRRMPYRISYAADAVAWTEVPRKAEILRRQRIRWHRGLLQVIWQYRGMIANPRYGMVGLGAWPTWLAFEFLAPILEFLGWFVIPASVVFGILAWPDAAYLIGFSIALGAGNSVLAFYLDDRFGFYAKAGDSLRLLLVSWAESFGLRQRTVWWRIRAMMWNPRKKVWGAMPRAGLGNLSGQRVSSPPGGGLRGGG
jgi:cellulose synthase/poly-beta-1,6-N-acetylglucosamine synthase-like glycosyltransferase